MLTTKQEKFARLVAEGKGQSEAYKLAYNAENMKPESINTEAYKVINNPDIALRIKELLDEMKEEMKITVQDLVRDLQEIESIAKQPIHGRDKENYDLGNWIKTKQEVAKLLGLYAPEKVDQTINLGKAADKLADAINRSQSKGASK